MSQDMMAGNFSYQLEAQAEDKPDFKIMTFENGDYPDEVLTYGDIVINGGKGWCPANADRSPGFARVLKVRTWRNKHWYDERVYELYNF